MVRGINRQSILLRIGFKIYKTLGEYKRNCFELYAYCLMGNHLHLLIKEGNEKIGNTMRRIGISLLV